MKRDAYITEITPLPYYNNLIETLCIALAYGVESAELDGIECYVLKSKDYEQYIDKETGLMVKQINRTNNTATDYHYEFGVVDEGDIMLPDISEYKTVDS